MTDNITREWCIPPTDEYGIRREFQRILDKNTGAGRDMENRHDFHRRVRQLYSDGSFIANISDRPMISDGIKTSESDKIVTQNFVRQHLDIGIETMQYIKDKIIP